MTQQQLAQLQATAAAGGSRTAGLGPAADEAHLGPLDSLLSLHESLAPLCEQEVVRISRQASMQPALQEQQPKHAGRQCRADDPAQPSSSSSSSTGQAIEGDAAAGPTELEQQQFVQQTGPWDWDFLLHQATLPYTTALKKGAVVLQQHLQPSCVMNGFSRLLQDLLGLQLLPRPAAATGPADVWAPHVLVLDVILQQQQGQQQQQQQGLELLGTVYIDIGGGYGARMLRYARSKAGINGAAAAADVSAYELPAVAVGISGARVPAPQCQQEQGAPTPHIEVTAAADASGSEASVGLVLSVAQLWELGHELGHAVHLVCSSR